MNRIHPWLRIALVLLVILAAGFFWFIRDRASRLVYPVPNRPLHTPDDYNLTSWEEITFTTTDDLTLSGWYIPPTPTPNGAALIFIHGLNSDRSALLDQAALLARHGYAALLFDLRAHGRSQGSQTTWGVAETADVQAAVHFLQQQPGIDPARIGLVGHSMGGAIAIQTAAVTLEVKVVIAESAYATFVDNAPRLTVSFARLPDYMAPLVLWQAGQLAGVNPQDIRPIDVVAGIAPRPILFIHGEQDVTVSVNNSRHLYETAEQPKELYLIPDAGHTDFMTADPEDFELQVVSFLERFLR